LPERAQAASPPAGIVALCAAMPARPRHLGNFWRSAPKGKQYAPKCGVWRGARKEKELKAAGAKRAIARFRNAAAVRLRNACAKSPSGIAISPKKCYNIIYSIITREGEAVSNLTKAAIKASVLKLLEEKPINKITVKDVVEDCGINRNSFYYHFQDLPAVIEAIVVEDAEAIINRYPTIDNFDQCLNVAVSYAVKNRKAVYHIYNSANRELFERCLFNVCEYVVTTYINKLLGEKQIDPNDKNILIRFYKCVCFGQVIDWMNGGMKESALDDFRRLFEIRQGLAEQLVKRCTDDKK